MLREECEDVVAGADDLLRLVPLDVSGSAEAPLGSGPLRDWA